MALAACMAGGTATRPARTMTEPAEAPLMAEPETSHCDVWMDTCLCLSRPGCILFEFESMCYTQEDFSHTACGPSSPLMMVHVLSMSTALSSLASNTVRMVVPLYTCALSSTPPSTATTSAHDTVSTLTVLPSASSSVGQSAARRHSSSTKNLTRYVPGLSMRLPSNLCARRNNGGCGLYLTSREGGEVNLTSACCE